MQAGQASLSCQDAGQASLRLSYAAAPGRNKTRHAGRYNPSAAALAGDARVEDEGKVVTLASDHQIADCI